MLRVTSRQRLVSWDAFDASAQQHEESHGEVEIISTLEQTPSPLLTPSVLVEPNPLVTPSPLVDSNEDADEESVSGYLTCAESLSRNASFLIPESPSFDNGNKPIERFFEQHNAEKYFMGQLASDENESVQKHRKKRDRNHEFKFATPESTPMKRNVSFQDTPVVLFSYPAVVSPERPHRLISSPRKWLSDKAKSLQEGKQDECSVVQLGVRNKDLVSNKNMVDLADDLKLQVFSYLKPKEIRTFSATCKDHWKLSRSLHVWDRVLRDQFSLLQDFSEGQVIYQDDYGVPTKEKQPHFSALHALAQPYPTHIDELFFKPKPRNKAPTFRSFNKNGNKFIQFTGRVGRGDRCVQSNVAFPHIDIVGASNSKKWCPQSLLDLFRRGGSSTLHSLDAGALTPSRPHEEPNPAQIMSRTWSLCGVTTLKPFVSPYVTKILPTQKKTNVEVNLSPRLFAYFEITIHERDTDSELACQRQGLRRDSSSRSLDDEPTSDCIAIGLSTSKFDVNHKMPGWCRHSYGFHGDDGGLFHGNGDMLRRFGPTFGVGDTVGCGIDYANHGIFFTINGKFVGYGWRGIKLNTALYPTVGVDSNLPLEINFGHSPFAFDLTPFSAQHKPLIETAFSGFPTGLQTA